MKSDRVVWFPIYIGKEKGTTFEKELKKSAGIIFDKYGVEKFRRIEVGQRIDMEYIEGVPVEFSEDNVGKGWAYFIFKDDNTKRRDLI